MVMGLPGARGIEWNGSPRPCAWVCVVLVKIAESSALGDRNRLEEAFEGISIFSRL